jgi:hypothetical protein
LRAHPVYSDVSPSPDSSSVYSSHSPRRSVWMSVVLRRTSQFRTSSKLLHRSRKPHYGVRSAAGQAQNPAGAGFFVSCIWYLVSRRPGRVRRDAAWKRESVQACKRERGNVLVRGSVGRFWPGAVRRDAAAAFALSRICACTVCCAQTFPVSRPAPVGMATERGRMWMGFLAFSGKIRQHGTVFNRGVRGGTQRSALGRN